MPTSGEAVLLQTLVVEVSATFLHAVCAPLLQLPFPPAAGTSVFGEFPLPGV